MIPGQKPSMECFEKIWNNGRFAPVLAMVQVEEDQDIQRLYFH